MTKNNVENVIFKNIKCFGKNYYNKRVFNKPILVDIQINLDEKKEAILIIPIKCSYYSDEWLHCKASANKERPGQCPFSTKIKSPSSSALDEYKSPFITID